MARNKPPAIPEDELRRSLLNQLTLRGASTEYFRDLVDKYLSLWRMAGLLEADVKTRGVVYMDVSAAGHEMMKNNPSVSEYVKVTTQMAKLLSQMNLSVGNVATAGDADDEL